MNNNGFGFLIGLGAGVGIGMLLAPRSGEKTRSMLRDKAADGATYLRQRTADARDVASETIREGTRKITKGTDAVRAAMDAGKQAYSEAIHS